MTMIRMLDPRDDRGASAVEYGLILFAVAAVVVAAVFAFGGAVDELFSDSCESLRSGTGTTETCG